MCMYIYIYIYVEREREITHIHIHIHTHTSTPIPVYMPMGMCTCTCLHLHTRVMLRCSVSKDVLSERRLDHRNQSMKAVDENILAAVSCHRGTERFVRHRLIGYLEQPVPSHSPASSSRIVFNRSAPKCMFPWRAGYPLSQVPIKPVPICLHLAQRSGWSVTCSGVRD